MKPVRTLPKFQCDFCNKRSTKHVMERNEPTCFRNPGRVCRTCRNRGTIREVVNSEERSRAALQNSIGTWAPIPTEEIRTVPCPDCARIKNPLK